MHWTIWSATSVGSDVLQAAGKMLETLAPVLLPLLL